jgi:hypothetical protein
MTLERQAHDIPDIPDIPDIQQRLMSFVRHQVALESWRSRHGSDLARRLVDEALADGDALQSRGIDREAAFALLEDAQQRINIQMK